MTKVKIRDGFIGFDSSSNYSSRWDEIFGKKENIEDSKMETDKKIECVDPIEDVSTSGVERTER